MTNYLNNAINGSVRIAFVIVPTVKATTHLLELALRTLNAGLGLINVQIKLPELKQETMQSKIYTYVHAYLPASITNQNGEFKKLSNTDVVKGAAFYTATAIFATFMANKFIGPMPEVYNTVSKFAGNALRIDTKFDVIQLAIDYVKKA